MGPLLENKVDEESQALEERSHSSWEPHSVPASQSVPHQHSRTFIQELEEVKADVG